MSALAARRRTGIVAAGFAAAMIGLAYASVPLYRMFCETTGFGGTTGRAIAAPGSDVLRLLGGRTVKVRFDSNLASGLAWQFRPRVNSVSVRIGEKNLAFFSATNRSAGPTTGQAGFNVSPDVAGQYFKKIECFCFTEQTLAAGETVQMPVTFFVDPAILKDPVASKIDEITLSYTFYPVDNPAPEAVRPAQPQTSSDKG